jgi:hypothetical protein
VNPVPAVSLAGGLIAAGRSSLSLVAQDAEAGNASLHKRSAVLWRRMVLIGVRNSIKKALTRISRQERRKQGYDRNCSDIKNDLLVET